MIASETMILNLRVPESGTLIMGGGPPRGSFEAKQGLEDGLTKDERVQLARYEQISTLRRLYLEEKEAKEAIRLKFLESDKDVKELLDAYLKEKEAHEATETLIAGYATLSST